MVAFLFKLDESIMSSRKILKKWFTETQGTILGFKGKSKKATTREREEPLLLIESVYFELVSKGLPS